MAKNSFVLYLDGYTDSIGELTYEQKGMLFDAIYNYAGANAKEPENLGFLNLALDPIKASINRDTEKYQKICDRNKRNGKKGGRPADEKNPGEPKKPSGLSGNPEKPKETQKNPSEPRKPDSDSVPDPDSDPDSDPESDKAFTKALTAPIIFGNLNLTSEEIKEIQRIRKKNNGGVITQRVASSLGTQFSLAIDAGMTIDDCLTEWEDRSWKTFKWAWTDKCKETEQQRISGGRNNRNELSEADKADLAETFRIMGINPEEWT